MRGDVVGYHGHFCRKVKITTKLTVGSLAFALPIAVLLYFMVAGVNASIRFSAMEFYGDAYQRPLEKLLEALPAHQRLLARMSQGASVLDGQLADVRRRVDQAFVELAEVNRRYGEDLQFTDAGLALRKRSHLKVPLLEAKWRAEIRRRAHGRGARLPGPGRARHDHPCRRHLQHHPGSGPGQLLHDGHHAPGPASDPGQAALDSSFGLWNAATDELDVLLNKRIDDYKGTRLASLVSTAVALVIALLLVYLIGRSVPRPLRQIQAFTQQVAGGDLKARIEGRFGGELAALSANILAMVGELKVRLGFAQGILHAISTPCLVTDTANRVTFINNQMVRLMECEGRADTLIGKSVGEISRVPAQTADGMTRSRQALDLQSLILKMRA